MYLFVSSSATLPAVYTQHSSDSGHQSHNSNTRAPRDRGDGSELFKTVQELLLARLNAGMLYFLEDGWALLPVFELNPIALAHFLL